MPIALLQNNLNLCVWVGGNRFLPQRVYNLDCGREEMAKGVQDSGVKQGKTNITGSEYAK